MSFQQSDYSPGISDDEFESVSQVVGPVSCENYIELILYKTFYYISDSRWVRDLKFGLTLQLHPYSPEPLLFDNIICLLTLCILMDFPIHIDTISVGLPTVY